MTIEREIDDVRSIRDTNAVTRGRRVSLLLVQERSRRLLFHENFMDKAATIKAKARLEHLIS